MEGQHKFYGGLNEVKEAGMAVSEFGIQVEEGRSPYLRREGVVKGEESRAEENALEGNELEVLAGRQAFGF